MNKLLLTPAGFKSWELAANFDIKLDSGENIRVPKGFKTDLASTPSFLWPILPPFGRYSQAAVVHDYLWETTDYLAKADKIFYELMLRYGTYPWKAKLMFIAVRSYSLFWTIKKWLKK